jgi:hypothetical protein
MSESRCSSAMSDEAWAFCKWCAAEWRASDTAGLAYHEARCPLSVTCPWCGATRSDICREPSGRKATPHSRRELCARSAAGAAGRATEEANGE